MALTDASPFDDPKVIAALDAPLDKKLTAQRDAFDGKGTKLTYLEGHAAIAQLNRLFGFDGWGYTVDAQGVDEYTDGPVEEWYAQFWAVVTLTVRGAPPRQDVGASEVQNRKYTDKRTNEVKVNNNVRKVDARSTARKGAVTDALKRAFRTFGQQGGNGLYNTDNDVYAWMVTHGVGDDATPSQEDAGQRQLYDAVAAAMRDDAPMAEALAAKGRTLDNLTVEELQQTLAALRSRAAKRAQQAADAPTAAPTPSEAPDYGPDYTDLHTALKDAHDASNVGEIRAARLAVEAARDTGRITNDGFTVLKKYNGDREQERIMSREPAVRR